MPQLMVRYRVRPDRVDENEQLVQAVYAELAVTQPDGLRYATFRLPDGVTFVHLAEHGDTNPLPQLPAFQRFVETIGERCEESPVTLALHQVGSYRMFEEER